MNEATWSASLGEAPHGHRGVLCYVPTNGLTKWLKIFVKCSPGLRNVLS